MKRPKGPELKMPELKVPSFLSNLYYDLRDRRLLPLVALVVVAIAAVPFLLGSDSEELSELPPEPSVIAALKEGGVRTSALTVVEAEPGLRDYRKRLRGRTPTDPFRQRQLPPPDLSGAQLGGGGEEASAISVPSVTSTSMTVRKTKDSTTTTKTTTTTTTGSGETPAGEEGAPGGGMPTELFTYSIDVKIARATMAAGGPPVTTEPTVRHGVRPLTPLPGEKTPAITYLGVNPSTLKPLFTVSRNVISVFGETKCVSGTDVCELLEMDPNFPVTFVYGPEEIGYRITVLKTEPIKQEAGTSKRKAEG